VFLLLFIVNQLGVLHLQLFAIVSFTVQQSDTNIPTSTNVHDGLPLPDDLTRNFQQNAHY